MLDLINNRVSISVDLDGSRLTASEREIIRLLLAGYSVAEISRLKMRTIKTVSTQKRSAYRKLGIRNDVNLYPVLMDRWRMAVKRSK